MRRKQRRPKKKINDLQLYRPSIDKYIRVMQREYNISKEDILLKYSWDDIQEAINDLPIERIITVYNGEQSKNKERYLNALCVKQEEAAMNQLKNSELEYERRKKLALEKQG